MFVVTQGFLSSGPMLLITQGYLPRAVVFVTPTCVWIGFDPGTLWVGVDPGSEWIGVSP